VDDSAELVYELESVGFDYPGGTTALQEITWSVRRGECWAVLGANGSGKSTLLKLLDGLYYATFGSLRFCGDALSEKAFASDDFNYAFRRQVGFVFQDPNVQLFSASVLDEVAFAPLQLGLSDAEVMQRVEQAMQALEVTKLADRPPHHLSGGEKKRVSIASVLTLEPQVWLLDEPTAGLDPRSQSWLVGFIRQRHALGETIVIATHDLSILQQVATDCLVFGEDHRIAAIGSPDDILADHALLHACNLMHQHPTKALYQTHGG